MYYNKKSTDHLGPSRVAESGGFPDALSVHAVRLWYEFTSHVPHISQLSIRNESHHSIHYVHCIYSKFIKYHYSSNSRRRASAKTRWA